MQSTLGFGDLKGELISFIIPLAYSAGNIWWRHSFLFFHHLFTCLIGHLFQADSIPDPQECLINSCWMKTFGGSTKYCLHHKSASFSSTQSMSFPGHFCKSKLHKKRGPFLTFLNSPIPMNRFVRLGLAALFNGQAHSSKALHLLRENSFWISPSAYTWTSHYVKSTNKIRDRENKGGHSPID